LTLLFEGSTIAATLAQWESGVAWWVVVRQNIRTAALEEFI
jgi:hypothetical protein